MQALRELHHLNYHKEYVINVPGIHKKMVLAARILSMHDAHNGVVSKK